MLWRARALLQWLALSGVCWTLTCQSYPFEVRPTQKVYGHQVTQVVATKKATDILFIIDDSGSMLDARTELAANIQNFISTLAASSFDFHVGIVTTDVECNVPERSCPNGPTSVSCCAITEAANMPPCQELDLNGDSKVDWSNCDGGRLRAPQGKPAFWTPPQPQDANQWAMNFSQMILNLGCQGSGLESGLEAARRAVNCSVFGYDAAHPEVCPSANIAALNANFIRPHADLVLVFVTDEDDCSFQDPNVYLRPADATDPNEQAKHLCSPQECYAYFGKANDSDQNGLQDWADPGASGGTSLFQCEQNNRGANPPYPVDVQTYINAFAFAKGGDITRVRAAGIVSGANDPFSILGLRGTPCSGSALGPTNQCGCWSASAVGFSSGPNFYCALTELLTHNPNAIPPNSRPNECSSVGAANNGDRLTPQPGCKGMPGSRYVQFLEGVYTARTQAAVHFDTLAASICQQKYSDTMVDIVNNIILTNCFNLGSVPGGVSDIQVTLNGAVVNNVPVGSKQPGWSWLPGAGELCLEGGLHKSLGDTFNIFVVDSQTEGNAAP